MIAGPPLLPWLGNTLSFDWRHAHLSYTRWTKKYGSIYHVKLGRMHQVVLSDPNLIREAFSRNEITGRPSTSIAHVISDVQGLVLARGSLWRTSRQLTIHHLRNFGMGKSKIESYVHDQIRGFMDQVLTPNCGTAIAIDHSLNVAVGNILWRIVASEELDITDHKIQNLLKTLMEGIAFADSLIIFDAVPWLRFFRPEFVFKKAKKEREHRELILAAFRLTLQQHRENLNLLDEPRDYIEALLQEQHHHPERMPDWHLLMCLRDLFVAGSDSTSVTLRWALCFLGNRPEVQRLLQAELDRQVGRQRLPSLTDRPRMPFTEAVILETQRLADIDPILVPHETLAPTTIGRHRLPAGVQVVADVDSMHHSAELFPEPLLFRPERFLDAHGDFRPDRNVMAFSVGRRQCLGEPLARAELFLFLTAFLQNFSFCWPEGEQHDLSEDYDISSFVRNPTPYKIIPRQR